MPSDAKLPPALQYAADAEQKRTEAANLAVRLEHVSNEYGELSVLFEIDGDATLRPKLAKLRAEKAEIAELVETKKAAAKQLEKRAAEQREADARRRNRARRKKAREASGERNAAAKRAQDAIERLVEAVAMIEDANQRMMLLWPAEIDPRGAAFYPGRLNQMIEHGLLAAWRKEGLKSIPAPSSISASGAASQRR